MTIRKNIDAITFMAMAALRGIVIPIPLGDAGARIIDAIPDLSGVDLPDGAERIEDALRYSDRTTRVSFIVVNTVMQEEEVHLTMVLDSAQYPVRTDAQLCDSAGVLAYVYNATYPDLSELGYVGFEKGADGNVHRVW